MVNTIQFPPNEISHRINASLCEVTSRIAYPPSSNAHAKSILCDPKRRTAMLHSFTSRQNKSVRADYHYDLCARYEIYRRYPAGSRRTQYLNFQVQRCLFQKNKPSRPMLRDFLRENLLFTPVITGHSGRGLRIYWTMQISFRCAVLGDLSHSNVSVVRDGMFSPCFILLNSTNSTSDNSSAGEQLTPWGNSSSPSCFHIFAVDLYRFSFHSLQKISADIE